MSPEEERNMLIGIVKDRYHLYDISLDQARQIYEYEQEKDYYSEHHFFSVWEELDYERSTFQEILIGEQLNKYDEEYQRKLKLNEQQLAEQDQEHIKQIAYLKERLDYYKREFFPVFFENPLVLHFTFIPALQAKIDYLKSEYKCFLKETKKAMIINHFRQYRTLKPNELKASRLRHQLWHILPDYSSFKRSMDEPLKAVVEHLKTAFIFIHEDIKTLFERKMQALRESNDACITKYYPDQVASIWIRQDEGDHDKEHQLMTLLLLDKEQYCG